MSCVPLLPFEAAAGAFGETQLVEEGEWQWVTIEGRRVGRGHFVAKVVGHSMEPLIGDGPYCLFATHVGGSRAGKVVLAQLFDAYDPETGSRFTVKRYESEKALDPQGGWRHARVTLRPVNPAYAAIELSSDDALRIVAELVEVLGTQLEEAP